MTRVLERSSEEGSSPQGEPFARVSRPTRDYAVARRLFAVDARKSRSRDEVTRGSLSLVWVTSHDGNAKSSTRLFAGEVETFDWCVRAS